MMTKWWQWPNGDNDQVVTMTKWWQWPNGDSDQMVTMTKWWQQLGISGKDNNSERGKSLFFCQILRIKSVALKMNCIKQRVAVNKIQSFCKKRSTNWLIERLQNNDRTCCFGPWSCGFSLGFVISPQRLCVGQFMQNVSVVKFRKSSPNEIQPAFLVPRVW